MFSPGYSILIRELRETDVSDKAARHPRDRDLKNLIASFRAPRNVAGCVTADLTVTLGIEEREHFRGELVIELFDPDGGAAYAQTVAVEYRDERSAKDAAKEGAKRITNLHRFSFPIASFGQFRVLLRIDGRSYPLCLSIWPEE